MTDERREEVLVALARRGWVRPKVAHIARATGLSEGCVRHVVAGRVDRVSRAAVARIYDVIGCVQKAHD